MDIPSRKRTKLKIMVIMLIFQLSGCLTTRIETTPLPTHFRQLLAANRHPIQLNCSAEQVSPNLGHQFLFLLLPFGQVVVDDPAAELCRIAKEELALKGFWISPAAPESVSLLLQELALSGYDLLLTRRVVVDGLLNATISYKGRKTEFQTVIDNGEFRRFAFEKDLREILQTGLREAIKKLLQELR